MYKARLVAKGYQSSNYAETYSPVGKLPTFRTLMSIVNEFDYEMVQMDVKTAFLHGDLTEEIYMNLPEGLAEKKYLYHNFDMVDLGEVKSFLGLEIDRDRIKIHQSAYIQQLLLKFQMQNYEEINTPIERNLKLNKAKSEDEKTNESYRQLQVSGLCQKRTLDSSWGTRKQSTVSLSSTEAEYKALTTAICESVFIKTFCQLTSEWWCIKTISHVFI
ncbi:hypothetical protein Trydic_g23050 [Trypoxylus dichotomus]